MEAFFEDTLNLIGTNPYLNLREINVKKEKLKYDLNDFLFFFQTE